MKQGGDRKSRVLLVDADSVRPRPASHGLPQAGFTIVETLIVLAVTGILFVSAAILINGRQQKAEFTIGINSLQQQLQQAINETSSGYYPNKSDFKCAGNSSGAPTFSTGSNAQGTNSGCIFMGKAIQFGTDTDSSTLGILPLVGNQYQAGTFTPVLNVTQAKPRVAYQASVVDTTLTEQMQNGLAVAASTSACPSGGMCYVNTSGAPKPTGIIAFVSGDSSGVIAGIDSSGNLQGGGQQLSLYGVSVGGPNASVAQASTNIGGEAVPYVTHLEAASSALICIASGTTNQSGLFTIDANLHVTLSIMSDKTC